MKTGVRGREFLKSLSHGGLLLLPAPTVSHTNFSKFANDTKLGNEAETKEHYFTIKTDLDKLMSWSDVWQTDFKIDKYRLT